MIDKTQDIKNQLIVLLDTSQEDSIRIGKLGTEAPASQEELAKVVLLDIATLCEALVVTIRGAHQMGIKPEADSMRDCIQHLNEAFTDSKMRILTPISPESE